MAYIAFSPVIPAGFELRLMGIQMYGLGFWPLPSLWFSSNSIILWQSAIVISASVRLKFVPLLILSNSFLLSDLPILEYISSSSSSFFFRSSVFPSDVLNIFTYPSNGIEEDVVVWIGVVVGVVVVIVEKVA